jgi:hypothetical protein
MCSMRRILFIGLLLLAFGLRVYGLANHPLWADEGMSLYFAPLTIVENAQATNLIRDVNPPVYRRTLGYWNMLAGTSPFASRYVTVCAGVLTVALAWAVGRRLAGARAGQFAALFVALAPLQIHFAQEAKGYALEQTLLLGATLAWLTATGSRLGGPAAERRPTPALASACADAVAADGRRPAPAPAVAGAGASPAPMAWVAYALCVAGALGTHYMAGLMIAVHGVWTLLTLLPLPPPASPGRVLRAQERREGVWGRGVRRAVAHGLALALAALLLAPWLWLTAGTTGPGLESTSSPHEGVVSLDLGAYLWRFGSEFAAGPVGATDWPVNVMATGVLGVLAICGIGVAAFGLRAAASRKPETENREPYAVELISWALLPLVLGFLFQLRFAFFFPRFLLYVTPALYLLAGLAVAALPRRVAIAPAAALALASLAALAPFYTQPVIYGENGLDWRPLLAQIRPHVLPHDTVIYSYQWVVGYFRSYLEGTPFDYRLGYYSPENVDGELRDLAEQRRRTWLVNYRTTVDNPGNLAAQWLNTHAARAAAFNGGPENPEAQIALYAWPEPRTGREGIAYFGPDLRLRYPVPTHIADIHACPDPLLDLLWEPQAAITADLHVYLHVLNLDGVLLAGADSAPLNGLAPTYTWQAGQAIADPRGLVVPPGVTECRVTLGVYDATTGARRPVTDADGRPLGDELQVWP